jgi:hypothetical protein
LTAQIHQEAIANNVTVLTLVGVENKALSYFTFTGKVTKVGTSAGHVIRSTKLVSIPIFVVFVLTLFDSGLE